MTYDEQLQKLIDDQVADMQRDSREFRDYMDAQRKRVQDSLNRTRPMNPAAQQVMQLLAANPMLAPKVLEFTQDLLAKVQGEINELLAVTPKEPAP